MPVCIDPSHAVGGDAMGLDGISDIYHVTAQAVIAGANMLLVDVHPQPAEALVDPRQAVSLRDLPGFLEDVRLCREMYLRRKALYTTDVLVMDAQ